MTKLKKSAVVIPALARIAVTAAASVSGTVAWFTANRAVSATAGTFTAYDDNGSLAITAAAGKGTTVVTNSNNVSVLGVLTDASFDFANVWTDVRDDDGEVPTAFKQVTDASYKTGSTNKEGKEVYYAVDWTYTITLTSKTKDNVDLFFDLSSTFTGRAAGDTSNGFRIAMVAGEKEESKQKLVWGVDGVKTHVSAVDNAQSEFDANEYTQTVSDYSKRADGGAGASKTKEYLGTFTPTSTSITITCTAWYEGTDPAVVSGKTRSSLSATRKFYARNAAKAAQGTKDTGK